MPTPQQLIDAAQDRVDAGQEARIRKLEAAAAPPVVQPAPVPPPTPPPPAPPPGEAPAPIPVFKPLSLPAFGAGPVMVGIAATRIGGVYPNALGVAGRRYRNGVLIPGATGADYTPIDADAGQALVFEECAQTAAGVQEWFRSPAVVPLAGIPAANATGRFTAAEVARALLTSIGLNEARMAGMTNGGDGWYKGADIRYGNEFRNLGQWFDWGSSGRDPGFWFEFVEAWGVLFHEEGSTQAGAADLRDMNWQIKYKGERDWVRLQAVSQMVPWGANYIPYGRTYQVDGQLIQAQSTAEGCRIQVPLGRSPHFTLSARFKVPRIDQIEGVMVTMLVRPAPDNPPGCRLVAHVGLDPKPSASGSTDGVEGAYVAAFISATCVMPGYWTRITGSNAAREGTDLPTTDGFLRRQISHARFADSAPLL